MQQQAIQQQSPGFFRGVQDMLPLSVAVIPWGILAGSAAMNAGLSILQAVGMSALVFAGAAQLVSLSMLMTGASLLSIILTVFFLTSQHFIYALSLREDIKPLPLSKRLSIGFLLTDELYATAMLKKQPSYAYMLGAGLSFYVSWVGFSLVGILLANTVPDLSNLHLEFSMVVVFLVMAVMLIQNRAAVYGVIASSLSVWVLSWLEVRSAILLAGFAGMWVAAMFDGSEG
ncbi:Inner membrane protein YgaZ [Acinetobacter bouvetii]|uniref:Inner membrane protein YgaZ n=1 Tax=Acinetobacter bouvetii TaxID=202951 RepID=A0A811G9Z4_9GAMM|nr:Inner membrane protein YgaZ [Acinetobacter bouvetii]